MVQNQIRLCEPGFYNNEQAQGSCKECTKGKFQDVVQSTSCKTCEAGYESLSGAAACTPIPPNVGALVGVPNLPQLIEGNTYTYEITLDKAPVLPVKVIISSSSSICTLTTESEKEFTTNDFNVPFTINIEPIAFDYVTAKASKLATCNVNHQVVSSDNLYANLTDATFEMTIISRGCGIGEYRGEDVTRGGNGTQCICSPRFYKPPKLDCQDCLGGLVCDEIGLNFPDKVPPVADGYWRDNATNHDFEANRIYECVIPDSCAGGNSTKGRCKKGYDNDMVLCAVCEDNYVFQEGVCEFCEGYVTNREISISMPPMLMLAGATVFSIFIFICYMFITRSAMTYEEEVEVRYKLLWRYKDLKLHMSGASEAKIEKHKNRRLKSKDRDAPRRAKSNIRNFLHNQTMKKKTVRDDKEKITDNKEKITDNKEMITDDDVHMTLESFIMFVDEHHILSDQEIQFIFQKIDTGNHDNKVTWHEISKYLTQGLSKTPYHQINELRKQLEEKITEHMDNIASKLLFF